MTILTRWCSESLIWSSVIEAAEIGETMSQYGLEPQEYSPVIDGRGNPQAWLHF
jgi:vacuolar iron transporter family protein